MLRERDSVGSKSYLERLRGVSCLIGKSLGRHSMAKQGRSLGIRCSFGVLVRFLLSLLLLLLTDLFLLIGKALHIQF